MSSRSVGVLLLAVFISLLGIGIVIPVLPVFATTLGAGGFALGMVMAVFSISRAVLQPFVGNWSDRLGRRRFLVAGLAVYGLVGMLTPFAGSVFVLILIRLLHGVGSAMIVPVAMAMMSSAAPAGAEGRYQSYLNAAVFCGIGFGPMIGGVLADSFGMPTVFYGMAVMSFIALLLVQLTLNEQSGSGTERPQSLAVALGQLRHDRHTLGILMARFATMLTPVPIMAFLPQFMMSWENDSYSGFAVGLVIACRTLVNAGLQIPFGRLADRTDRRRLLVSGGLLMAALLFLIPFCRTLFPLVLVYLVIGAVEALLWAVLGAFASIEGKAQYGHGTMMGLYGFAMSCGVFCGAVLSGSSVDLLGVGAAYQVVGGTLLLLFVVAIVLLCPKEEENGRNRQQGSVLS